MKKLIIILSIALFSCAGKEGKIQDKAEEFVKNTLKSPSTAKFVDNKMVYKKDHNYIVFVSVDAQNSFGATLRENYMVAFTLDANNKLNWDDKFGMQKASPNPSPEEVAAMAVLNRF